LLQVDVFAFEGDCLVRRDAVVWMGCVLIGFGSYVHAISLEDHSVVTLELGAYYGYFYPTPGYLLIASGERLFRMEPDRSILWKSAVLAVDGVLVHDAGPPHVRGDGEWDPPGGWEPFSLDAADGRRVEDVREG
jgi:hypothetical protein